KIEIQREENPVNLKDFQINMPSADDAQYINTKLNILKSPKIAYRVAIAMDLEHNSNFPGGKAQPSNSQPESLAEIDGENDQRVDMDRLKGIIDTLVDRVDVKPVRETRLVEIHFRNEDSEMARKIADTWADAFIQNSIRERSNVNKQAATYLDS